MTLPTHFTEAGGITYAVIVDLTATFQAFITGRAVDELDGNPPEVPVALAAALRGIRAGAPGEETRFALKTGQDGAFAVSGDPARALPNHATTAYTVDVTVRADGYLPAPLAVAVPAGSSFPLAPITASLHRPAVMLKGRVTDANGAPLSAAQVTITDPPGLAGLQWPLDFEHAPATPVTAVTLTPAGPALTLTDPAFAGDASLRLAQRLNLAAGAPIQLGTGPQSEYAVVDHLEGPATLSRPGRAVLRAPLHADYAAGAGVRPLNGAAGAATPISLEAVPGDAVLIFAAATTLSTGDAIEITDADPTRVEYRLAVMPRATTDAQGFYRMGPVARTAAPNLHVVAAAHAPVDVTWLVDYGRLENVRNVRVP